MWLKFSLSRSNGWTSCRYLPFNLNIGLPSANINPNVISSSTSPWIGSFGGFFGWSIAVKWIQGFSKLFIYLRSIYNLWYAVKQQQQQPFILHIIISLIDDEFIGLIFFQEFMVGIHLYMDL